ncbi:MAG: hypothetical protein WCO26_25870, partial [Deltaproteobacteria bacterium]
FPVIHRAPVLISYSLLFIKLLTISDDEDIIQYRCDADLPHQTSKYWISNPQIQDSPHRIFSLKPASPQAQTTQRGITATKLPSPWGEGF